MAKYILAALSASVLIAVVIRLTRNQSGSHPQTRTWLLIAVIFGLVSAWLFYRPDFPPFRPAAAGSS